MIFKYGEQISIDSLTKIDVSLFLLALNHEERVFSGYQKIIKSNVVKRTVGFAYHDYPVIVNNKKVEQKTIKDHEEIIKFLDQFIESLGNPDKLNIIVDYSCMTKSWYYTILLYFSKKRTGLRRVDAYFVYTPSVYTEPLKPKPNTEIAPLPGKYFVPTDKPKVLIVCLGYEQNKAQGIIDHLDPKDCYIFYTNPALDPHFVTKLKTNNEEILKRYQNVITYPFDDLVFLERELTSIYQLLKDKFSIIIAPLGPKPFTLMAMLLSIKYSNIDIWRVGSGPDINKYSRPPIENNFIVSRIVYQSQEK